MDIDEALANDAGGDTEGEQDMLRTLIHGKRHGRTDEPYVFMDAHYFGLNNVPEEFDARHQSLWSRNNSIPEVIHANAAGLAMAFNSMCKFHAAMVRHGIPMKPARWATSSARSCLHGSAGVAMILGHSMARHS